MSDIINDAVIKPKRKKLIALETLNEEEIKQLEMASNITWEAMERLIKKDGYSDLTLNLEGTVYELNSIIAKHKGKS